MSNALSCSLTIKVAINIVLDILGAQRQLQSTAINQGPDISRG